MNKTVLRISIVIILVSLAAFFAFRTFRKLTSGRSFPEIVFDSDAVYAGINVTDEELLAGVTATDLDDGDISGSLIIESRSYLHEDGSITVTYAAFDSDRNVVKKSRKLFYTDYTKPVFRLDRPLIATPASISEIAGVMDAYDVIDGDISQRVKVTYLDRLTTNIGTYPVEFRITNSIGDTVYLETELECANAGYNNADIKLTDYLVYLHAGDPFDPASYVKGYKTADGPVTGAEGLQIDSGVNMNEPGVYSVTYTLEQTDSTSHTRLIAVILPGEEAGS